MKPPIKGSAILSFVERLSSFGGYFVQSVYTTVFLDCPLLGGLSYFGVSFIGGFSDLGGSVVACYDGMMVRTSTSEF